MAPFCASCSTASAAASGSPFESTTSTCTLPRPCRSRVSAMPLRAWSANPFRSPVSGSTMPISLGLSAVLPSAARCTARAPSA